MKLTALLSVLAFGLSTFLLSAQTQVGLSVETNPSNEAAPEPTDAAAEPGAGEKKTDINALIQSASEFTNSVGMVMKKVGGLWVSIHETTQEAYQKVTGSNPSAFGGSQRPVDTVSWNDAVAFCEQLSDHEKGEKMMPDGYRYSLPTQAQWEGLAAGVSLADSVTSSDASRPGTATVGSMAPSGDGVYDLRGNVAEWSSDPSDGGFRVLRGGSWEDWIEVNLRPAFRIMVAPNATRNTYGFRVVLIED